MGSVKSFLPIFILILKFSFNYRNPAYLFSKNGYKLQNFSLKDHSCAKISEIIILHCKMFDCRVSLQHNNGIIIFLNKNNKYPDIKPNRAKERRMVGFFPLFFFLFIILILNVCVIIDILGFNFVVNIGGVGFNTWYKTDIKIAG